MSSALVDMPTALAEIEKGIGEAKGKVVLPDRLQGKIFIDQNAILRSCSKSACHQGGV
jgi:hypothetical protein